MIWFFAREDGVVQLEIRQNMAGAGCELVVTYPNGLTRTDEVGEPADVLTRTVDVLKALRADGWVAQPRAISDARVVWRRNQAGRG